MNREELDAGKALRMWYKVCMDLVLDDANDLTMRQMTILLAVYLEPPPHTVRGLATKLNVTKPVITRALDTMGRLNLVKRRRDPDDRRNVIISRTVEGALYLERLADLVSQKAKEV